MINNQIGSRLSDLQNGVNIAVIQAPFVVAALVHIRVEVFSSPNNAKD
jgi:hypothetical protein